MPRGYRKLDFLRENLMEKLPDWSKNKTGTWPLSLSNLLKSLVELSGIEPLTSTMPL